MAVAEIARPHGVKGELRLKLYNPDSELLLSRPPIRLVLPDGERRAAEIRAIRVVPKTLLIRLAGVGDRDAADALRGAQLEVARDLFAPADDDEFYVCDLTGCEVRMADERIGTVKTVAAYPTCDVLVVQRDQGPRLEVPMLSAYVGDIDLEGRTVSLLSIEGLD